MRILNIYSVSMDSVQVFAAIFILSSKRNSNVFRQKNFIPISEPEMFKFSRLSGTKSFRLRWEISCHKRHIDSIRMSKSNFDEIFLYGYPSDVRPSKSTIVNT